LLVLLLPEGLQVLWCWLLVQVLGEGTPWPEGLDWLEGMMQGLGQGRLGLLVQVLVWGRPWEEGVGWL
jgi:hypothetical protein